MSAMDLAVRGQTLRLLPERAVEWCEQSCLIFSDVHLGKAESYRAEGVNIPVESGASDLQKMRELTEKVKPRDVFILGDFIHHRKSWTKELISELARFFSEHRTMSWNLILGNHERGSLPFLNTLPLKLLVDDFEYGPFLFSHGHRGSEVRGPGVDLLQISGHVHPIMTLREGPLQMRCPCFVLSENGLLLPSFGTWTGGAEVSVQHKHRYFAVAGKDVFEVETSRARRRQEEPGTRLASASSVKKQMEDL